MVLPADIRFSDNPADRNVGDPTFPKKDSLPGPTSPMKIGLRFCKVVTVKSQLTERK